MNLNNVLLIVIATLGVATYVSAVYQMIFSKYSPSFFTRGVWLLLGVNSLIGVLFGEGTKASVILAVVLLIGNAAVFLVSYKKGSREFGLVEKFSLVLLIVAILIWVILDAPFITLVISLIAHFIGGVPTIWRTVKKPESEQALHWYLFFAASVLTIVASPNKSITAILFPVYFVMFEGLIIILANRKRLFSK